MKNTVRFMSAIILLVWVGTAQALMMAYDNLADWTAAIGGAPVVSDPFDSEIPQGGSITFDSGVQSAVAAVFLNDNSVWNGKFVMAVGGDPYIAAPFNDWQFPDPIFAFGFDFSGINALAGTSVLIDDGSGPLSFELYGIGDSQRLEAQKSPRLGGKDGFAGFVSDSGTFEDVRFYSQFDLTDAYSLDNLVFASRIPVPGSLTLFSLGLVGLVWLKRSNG